MVLKLTKEAKVTGVYDCLSICLPCNVVQGGQTTSNVCNTKDTAMGGIEYFCLGIYLVTSWARGESRVSRGRCGALHFYYVEVGEKSKIKLWRQMADGSNGS